VWVGVRVCAGGCGMGVRARAKGVVVTLQQLGV